MYVVYTTNGSYASGTCKKFLQTLAMTTTGRIIATIPKELFDWVVRLEIGGPKRTRIVTEALVALHLADDAERNQAKVWASRFEAGLATCADLEAFRELSEREKTAAIHAMMELLLERGRAQSRESRVKPASQRGAKGRRAPQ